MFFQLRIFQVPFLFGAKHATFVEDIFCHSLGNTVTDIATRITGEEISVPHNHLARSRFHKLAQLLLVSLRTSLNIWRQTLRLVNNARYLPPNRRVFSPLTSVMSHRDTQLSNALFGHGKLMSLQVSNDIIVPNGISDLSSRYLSLCCALYW